MNLFSLVDHTLRQSQADSVHATVKYAFAAVFGVQPAAVSNLLWYAPVFGVGLLLAWLLYRFVEHPVEAKMRRFGNKKFQRSAA